MNGVFWYKGELIPWSKYEELMNIEIKRNKEEREEKKPPPE